MRTNLKLKKNYGARILSSNDLLVFFIEGITLGINQGQSFHTAKQDWPKEDQINWARAQSLFFLSLSRKCDIFADVVESESKNAQK